MRLIRYRCCFPLCHRLKIFAPISTAHFNSIVMRVIRCRCCLLLCVIYLGSLFGSLHHTPTQPFWESSDEDAGFLESSIWDLCLRLFTTGEQNPLQKHSRLLWSSSVSSTWDLRLHLRIIRQHNSPEHHSMLMLFCSLLSARDLCFHLYTILQQKSNESYSMSMLSYSVSSTGDLCLHLFTTLQQYPNENHSMSMLISFVCHLLGIFDCISTPHFHATLIRIIWCRCCHVLFDPVELGASISKQQLKRNLLRIIHFGCCLFLCFVLEILALISTQQLNTTLLWVIRRRCGLLLWRVFEIFVGYLMGVWNRKMHDVFVYLIDIAHLVLIVVLLWMLNKIGIACYYAGLSFLAS